MKKKGFTLIELLAIIIILGIVGLIAVPMVNNYIRDAGRDSFKVSIQNMIRSMKTEQVAQGNVPLTYEFPLSSDSTLELEGDTSEWEGTASINDDGETSVAIYDGNYCGYKNKSDEDITMILVDSKEECMNKVEDTTPTTGAEDGTADQFISVLGIEHGRADWAAAGIFRYNGRK